MCKRCAGIWERKQIVEIDRVVGRPGEVFGDQCRLVAFDKGLETHEMLSAERLWTADRHAHTVERYRIVASNSSQCIMRRPAGTHVVLSVNLKKALLLRVGQDGRQMLMLKAGAC